MINFNQDLATTFVAGLVIRCSPEKLQALYDEVVASSGPNSVEEAIKNCQCDSISYNNVSEIRERLLAILMQMAYAPSGVLFGALVPEFFCLGQKAIELSKQDGKTRSKSIDQGTTQDPSGS